MDAPPAGAARVLGQGLPFPGRGGRSSAPFKVLMTVRPVKLWQWFPCRKVQPLRESPHSPPARMAPAKGALLSLSGIRPGGGSARPAGGRARCTPGVPRHRAPRLRREAL